MDTVGDRSVVFDDEGGERTDARAGCCDETIAWTTSDLPFTEGEFMG